MQTYPVSHSSSSVCMFQVFSLKWMKMQKGTAGVPTKRDLSLLPPPLCRLPAAAPPKHGCLPTGLFGLPGRTIVQRSRTRLLGTITSRCSRVLRLVSMRNSSVPARPPTLWLAPTWPPPCHRATWWNKVPWGNWSGTTQDILSWEQEVTPGRADSSGTKARRSSQQWRSLLVKLRCMAQASKGWLK